MTVKAPSPVALRCCWVGFWSESLGAEEVSEEKQSGLRRSRCEACSFSFVFYVIWQYENTEEICGQFGSL